MKLNFTSNNEKKSYIYAKVLSEVSVVVYRIQMQTGESVESKKDFNTHWRMKELIWSFQGNKSKAKQNKTEKHLTNQSGATGNTWQEMQNTT